jgi:anti-sigma B factor antagonist
LSQTGPAEFGIETRSRDQDGRDLAIVHVKGEVDLAHADDLAAELLSDGCRGAAGVVLDMSELEFMDSSGLRAVLVAVEELECPLVAVVAPGSSISRLFELAEVGERLGTFPDEDAAVASLAKVA